MKARVIVTLDCNRNCENCCNKEEVFEQHEVLNNIDDLLTYDEILITGGEPMLIPMKVRNFIQLLREKKGYKGKIYLYTALYDKYLDGFYRDILDMINGLHFTVHFEAKDKEIIQLKILSESSLPLEDKSCRLAIDSRVYDKYDFSNINFSAWKVVRKLKWLLNCPLPTDEKLFVYDL